MINSRRYLLVGGGINHRIAERVSERGGQALTISPVPPTRLPVDHMIAELATPQAWVAAVQAGFMRLGGVDVLVNCGGALPKRGQLAARPDEDWFTEFLTVVTPVLRGCLRAIELMGQNGGVIVNVTGTRAWPDDVLAAPSLAAFAALEATTHTLALQAGTHQIRLFGVAPEVHLRTRVRKAGQLADRSTRYPLIAFAGSVAVVDSILGLIEDPQAHDATYRLDSGQLF